MRRAAGICAAVLVLGWGSCVTAQPDQTPPSAGSDPTTAVPGAGASIGIPVADDWRAICLSHRDDFEQAGRTAQASGWMVAPDSIVPPFKNAVGKPRAWLHSSARGLEILAIGRLVDGAVDDGPKFPARFCGVAAGPAQAGVAHGVGTFLSIPPNASGARPGRVTFVYRHTSRGLSPILSNLKDPGAIHEAQTSDVDFVQIEETAESTNVLLVVPESAAGDGAAAADGGAGDAPTAPHQPGLVSMTKALPVPEGRSWFNCPTSKAFLKRYYPKQAQRTNIQGEATIQCHLRANGELSECAWVTETPPNLGFGETAEKLGCLMKFKTTDDVPIKPYLLIPIHFRLPN